MIYIQSDIENKIPHHFDASCAMYGAIENGIPYKLISYENLISGKYDKLIKTNLFVGSVEFLTEVFNRIDKSPRVPLNSNRQENIIKLNEARKRIEEGETLFIKPYQIKLFTGMVYDKRFIFCLNPYPEDTDVIISEPFEYEIKSEWRCYVHMNKVVDIRNYLGDIYSIPDEKYLLDTINKNNNFPISYTIDIAILENNENVVVEFNDMWAIGNYGMDNSMYLRLLKQRYFEIVRN